MKLRFSGLASIVFVASSSWASSNRCATVDGDRLQARQLAALVPAFSSVPPDTVISPSPVPGARRIFHFSELAGLARRFAVPLDAADDICFEWPLAPLNRDAVVEAMKEAFAGSDVHVEIVETSGYPVPPGKIEFRREGLGRPADPNAAVPVIWRGNVVYGDNHKFSIWARARLSGAVERVVAGEDLKRGVAIQPGQLRIEPVVAFPLQPDTALTIEAVAGKAPIRDVPAGAAVHPSLLMQPAEVGRGDMVDVEVHAGAARLVLTAKAEASGRRGELIALRNLSSNRTFSARVTGRGRAVITLEASSEVQ